MFPRASLTLLFVGILASSSELAQGQSTAPPEMRTAAGENLEPGIFEASLGFTYLRATNALAKNEYGADASLFANLNSWLAVGAEFIGTYGSKNHQISFAHSTDVDESRLVYVAGPRVNVWQTDKWKVFVEALGGGAHGHVSALIFGFHRSASADGFAGVIGAGAEWKFTRRIAWRIVETDYIAANFNDQWENDWRVSTGLSYSFGNGW